MAKGTLSTAFFLVRQNPTTVFCFFPLRSISLATLSLLSQHQLTPSVPFIKTLFRANNSLTGPATWEVFQSGSQEGLSPENGARRWRRKSGAHGGRPPPRGGRQLSVYQLRPPPPGWPPQFCPCVSPVSEVAQPCVQGPGACRLHNASSRGPRGLGAHQFLSSPAASSLRGKHAPLVNRLCSRTF